MKKTKKSVKQPPKDDKYLKKGKSPRVRHDYMDVDYLKELKAKDKKAYNWYIKFLREYVNADLNYKSLRSNLHNTKALKKSCTDMNNSRNRDTYSITKANNLLTFIPEWTMENDVGNGNKTEDTLIEFIDNQHLLALSEEELLKFKETELFKNDQNSTKKRKST